MHKMCYVLIILFLLSPVFVFAGDIEGTVTVLRKKGDKPLKTFDNTAVFIKGLKTETAADAFQLDQKRKQFLPRLSIVQAGQTVNFANNDKVKHNVFSKDLDFDLGYMKSGEVEARAFDDLGVYKVYCNIHIDMIADLLIVENPYYALTDKKGNFSITGIPDGKYTLAVWHIYGGQTEIPITVSDQNDPLEITIKSKKVVREIKDHLNKLGQEYPDDDDYY